MTQEPSTQDRTNDEFELKELFLRLKRGIPQIIAFSLIAAGIGMIAVLFNWHATPSDTSIRIAFSFPGFERGRYPDGSNFQADDLRSADLVALALKNLNLTQTDEMQSILRGAISVVGIIPANIAKERDRIRAAGQVPAPFVPDEYIVSLDLPRNVALSSRDRELFLNELVSLFQTRFQRLYADLPSQYGTAFASLKGSDYFEYELILNKELRNLRDFLTGRFTSDRNFRSPSTGLSFNDLITQIDLFSQLRVNGVMGMIYNAGLTKNRDLALRKIDYQLGLLNDSYQRELQEQRVIQDLLANAQQRSQSYVLGTKSQAESDRPLVDQGLIDSLIANDAYNFLVRKALDAGVKALEVHADIEQLGERKKSMESFVRSGNQQVDSEQLLTKELTDLEAEYNHLIDNVKKTNLDYAHQQYADSVRITMQPTTAGLFHELRLGASVGLLVGCALACGLSLLGVNVSRRSAPGAAHH